MLGVLQVCPGCSALVTSGRCQDCARPRIDAARARRSEIDRHRGSARARGYDRKWERRRLAWLQAHPLCAHCQHAARPITAASVVDHIVPHRGDATLFHAAYNLQSLCVDCHATKGLRESSLIPCPHSLLTDVLGREVCALCGAWR